MKKGLSFFAALVAATILLLSVREPAFAREPKIAAPKSFKADFTYQEGNNPPEKGVMYFAHGNIREEVTPVDGGPKKITIIDQISKSIYVVDEEKKTFKTLPWDARAALTSQALKRFEKHKMLGTKTIDGHLCDDFEITPRDKSIRPFCLFVNKETRYPVELETEDTDPSKQIRINWSNLTPGYQAAIMFAPPLGYKQVK